MSSFFHENTKQFLPELETSMNKELFAARARRNSRLDTPSPARRIAVRQYRSLGYDGWARLKGYGRRWMVETAFSTFKRLFGEHSLARSLENIAQELVAKVALYNILVNP